MHPQTLRMYEARGLIEPSRSPKGTRLYSQADVERLRRIQQMTAELGLNLAGRRARAGARGRARRAQRAAQRDGPQGASRRAPELSSELDRLRRSMSADIVRYSGSSTTLVRQRTRGRRSGRRRAVVRAEASRAGRPGALTRRRRTGGRRVRTLRAMTELPTAPVAAGSLVVGYVVARESACDRSAARCWPPPVHGVPARGAGGPAPQPPRRCWRSTPRDSPDRTRWPSALAHGRPCSGPPRPPARPPGCWSIADRNRTPGRAADHDVSPQ